MQKNFIAEPSEFSIVIARSVRQWAFNDETIMYVTLQPVRLTESQGSSLLVSSSNQIRDRSS